jgi:hypothetical protein
MLVGSILLQVIALTAGGSADAPAVRALDALVGHYNLYDSGAAAGSLVVSRIDGEGAEYEAVFSLGQPDTTERTVLTIVPTSELRMQVRRSDTMHDFIQPDAEAHLAGNGLLFDFVLPSRTGAKVLLQDLWQQADNGLLITSTAWPPKVSRPKTLRVLKATRVQ